MFVRGAFSVVWFSFSLRQLCDAGSGPLSQVQEAYDSLGSSYILVSTRIEGFSFPSSSYSRDVFAL